MGSIREKVTYFSVLAKSPLFLRDPVLPDVPQGIWKQ